MKPVEYTKLPILLMLCGLSLACEVDKESATPDLIDEDGDGVIAEEDCDDSSSWVYPGAAEACDGVDNDCDGEIDEDLYRTYYTDADSDGYGDSASPVEDCEAPSGAVSDSSDCDDGDAEVNPGAVEECDSIDNDCDSLVDEDVQITVYSDADGDGHGEDGKGESACEAGSGQVLSSGDCDDTDSDIHPDAAELCDEIDNDCDGLVDDDDVIDDPGAETFYADADDDNWGDPDAPKAACEQPEGYVDNADDCDDNSRMIKPDGLEVCDEIDNDCDGLIDDEDSSLDTGTAYELYPDVDGDGWGEDGAAVYLCEDDASYVNRDGDCDDTDPDVHALAEEICDELDNDCNGDVDDDCEEPATEWASWAGWEAFEYSEGGGFGDRNCDLFWDAQGIAAGTSGCTDCEFVFEIDMTYEASLSSDDGICSKLTLDQTYTYGYAEDYYGYGSYLMYGYYGTFSAWAEASFDSSSGEISYNYGYEDWDYYGTGSYYTYLFTGEAELAE